jgi:peptide/nickel transport system substrate-binding protein
MARRIALLLLSALLIMSLLLVSCAEKATPTTGPGPTTTTSTPTKTTNPPQTASDKPQYGGTISVILISDILGFDLSSSPNSGATIPYTNNGLIGGDWSKGPAGTNEVTWTTNSGWYGLERETGRLAESWEIPELGTIIFHIRKGVHYALNPNSEASRLMNGREVTAQDVVFTFKRSITEFLAFPRISQPALSKTATFEATDDYTVVMKTPVDAWTGFLMFGLGIGTRVMAPEVIQKYGNQLDWRNSAGTGPYMLTDFVSNSQATLKRNPNYWDTDPCGPGKGNQLPYADTLKMLIISDASTQMAAMRSGKADIYSQVTWDDAASLMATNRDLKYVEYVPDLPNVIGMRTDKADSPFHDVRVRQALMKSLDFEALKEFYGGKAEIISWPITYQPGNADLIDPLDKQPAAVQALYSHDIAGAKQLLADAGYPDGFKTSIITSPNTIAVDLLSAIKSQWVDINVDLDIQIREGVVLANISNSRNYSDMLYAMALGCATYANMANFRGPSIFNRSYWNDPVGSDPVSEKVYQEIQKNLLVNDAETRKAFHDLMPYLLEQVPVISPPIPFSYNFWQPWLKNHHGEVMIDYSMGGALMWAWVDQDMKNSMTGR